jgi:hypothetical protein
MGGTTLSPSERSRTVMAERLTLEQVFRVWKQEPGQVTRGHLAESRLVSLLNHTLSPEEHEPALQHLATCSLCRQAVKGLLQAAETTPVTLMERRRLAAAGGQSNEPTLLTEDTTGQVQFLEERDADGRFLTLRVKLEFRRDFEGRHVIVWDEQQQPLCTGQITEGTLCCELEADRDVTHPLRCTLVPQPA